MLGAIAHKAAKRFGYQLSRVSTSAAASLPDLPNEIHDVIDRARPFTMTSYERLAALCMAVEHVNSNSIPGAFVECGVWKGGSSMAIALSLRRFRREDAELYLFDTFEGMSQPTSQDVRVATGETAQKLLTMQSKDSEVWARASLQEVRQNLETTGYPSSRIHLVQGMVESTIPITAPDKIALLRLDTDWYESTRHELIHLFPRLSKNGVLIIDDYGHWAGAKKAVDEYFEASNIRPFLFRIDDTGRLYIKS
jgi:O-methyltransferase